MCCTVCVLLCCSWSQVCVVLFSCFTYNGWVKFASQANLTPPIVFFSHLQVVPSHCTVVPSLLYCITLYFDCRVAKRAKYSRRRAFDEDEDIDYINVRNMKFNKKLERFYGKYTTEIKQNLERGTAVWETTSYLYRLIVVTTTGRPPCFLICGRNTLVNYLTLVFPRPLGLKFLYDSCPSKLPRQLCRLSRTEEICRLKLFCRQLHIH